jgi:outer membrane receptor protein involved in Fe transport
MMSSRLCQLAIGTAFTALMATPVLAQFDDEIIVTATKRQTTLQDTPVAVSVTDAETIENARILDLNDLQSVVPSLRVNQLQTSTNTNFIIRGFGNGANNAGVEPSVGVFVDGVYRSRSAARIGDLPKLERVEVLRGPQSTLFGKNASAGVISLVTAEPSFDREGYVELGYGNYDNFTGRAYLTNGLGENVAFSLGGGFNIRDGYAEPADGLSNLSSFNDRNRWNIQGQILFEPSDTTSFRLIADYNTLDETCCAITNFQNEGAINAIRALGGRTADADDPFAREVFANKDSVNEVDDYGISLQVDHDFGFATLTSITAYRENDTFFDSDSDFTTLDILNTVSTRNDIDTFTQELRLTSNTDGPLSWMIGGFLFDENVGATDELIWGADARRYIDVLAGSPALFSTIEAANGFTPGTTFFGQGRSFLDDFTQDNTAWSLFGTVDFEVTDRLTLTGGLNYTDDDKSVSYVQTADDPFFALDLTTVPGPDLLALGSVQAAVGDPTNPLFQAFGAAFAPFGLTLTPQTFGALATGQFPNAMAQGAFTNVFLPNVENGIIAGLQNLQFNPPALAFPNAIENGESDDSKLTYTARAAYEVSDNVNVYASVATGFKSSSWNLSRGSRPFFADGPALQAAGLLPANYVLGATPATSRNFGTRFAGPEEATVYEIGLKARFEKGAINIALFDQTIEGFQSNIFLGSGFSLANAGEQSTKGLEVDAMFRPSEMLELTFAGTFLDPIYDSFVNGPAPGGGITDLSGERPAGIPETSLNIGANFYYSVGDNAEGYLRADWQYESEVLSNEAIFTTTGAQQPFREVSTFNASAGVSFDNGFSVQLWGRNIFNDEYVSTVFPGVLQTGVINGYVNAPRTYGINLRKDF